jgi:pimeloyl-ACP methyl ester carboxylesterase
MSIFDPAQVESAARADAAFKLSLRFLTGNIRFKVGDEAYLLVVSDGDFVSFGVDSDRARPANLTFSAPAGEWEKLLAPEATLPGYQHLLYSDGRAGIQRDGDMVEDIAPFARAMHEFYRILRKVVGGVEIDGVLPRVDRDFDSAVGRYVYLHIDGVQHRIYYEESGSGSIPLIMQHTAGADSGQFRHLMEDPDFQKHYRMIAYDLPFHGRSLPPTSQRWWEEPFVLTKSVLFDLIFGLCERLGLDRPVFMGSAIGGMLALDLAYYHPDKVRAVIALNAGPPANFLADGLPMIASFSDPRVNGYWASSIMLANMAGTSRGALRRELAWVYGQSAPGVSEAALHYYATDHDLSLEQAASIDTSKVPVYLFTGQDDIMANDWGSPLLANAMKNSPFKMLQKLGHFGAAENPEAFKADIWPTLREIATVDA